MGAIQRSGVIFNGGNAKGVTQIWETKDGEFLVRDLSNPTKIEFKEATLDQLMASPERAMAEVESLMLEIGIDPKV